MSVAHGRVKSHRGKKSCRDWEEVTPSLIPLPPQVCCAKSLQSCPTLFNPKDYSLPGSSVHWILQVRILDWAKHTSNANCRCQLVTSISNRPDINCGFYDPLLGAHSLLASPLKHKETLIFNGLL